MNTEPCIKCKTEISPKKGNFGQSIWVCPKCEWWATDNKRGGLNWKKKTFPMSTDKRNIIEWHSKYD